MQKEIRLNYTRQLSVLAVYDIADAQNAEYLHDGVTDDIKVALTVFENKSGFIFSFSDDGNAVRLTVSIESPAKELSEDGQSRAVNYLADCVMQHLENEMNGIRAQTVRH